MLQMEELIQRIEATEESPRPDHEDPVGREIDRVLDHLRAAKELQVCRSLQPEATDPLSRPDLWYH